MPLSPWGGQMGMFQPWAPESPLPSTFHNPREGGKIQIDGTGGNCTFNYRLMTWTNNGATVQRVSQSWTLTAVTQRSHQCWTYTAIIQRSGLSQTMKATAHRSMWTAMVGIQCVIQAAPRQEMWLQRKGLSGVRQHWIQCKGQAK